MTKRRIKSEKDIGVTTYLIDWLRDLSCLGRNLYDKTKQKGIKFLNLCFFFLNYLSDQKSPKSLENKQDMH